MPPSFDIFVSDDLVNWVRLTGKTSADDDRSFQLNTDTYILDLNVPCTTKYVLFQGTGVRPGFGDKYWPLDKFELYQGETKLKLKEQRSQTTGFWMFPCEGPGIELASAQKIKNVAVYTDRPACDFRLVTTSTRSGGELKDYVDFGTLKGTTKVSDGLYMHVFEGSATAKYIIALPTVDMMDERFASNVKPDVSFRISEIKAYAPLSMTKEEPVSVRVNGEPSATLTDGDRDRVVVPIGKKSAGRFFLTFKEPTRLSEASFYTAADSGALLLLGTADETVTASTIWKVVGYKQPGQKGAEPGWRDVELDDTVELRHLYYSDTEKYAKFYELRKLIQKGLIGSASYALNEESGLYELTLGMDAGIFVENRNGKFSGSVGQDVNSYLKAGPNNETYLDGTDGTRALVFYVKADEAMAEQYRTLQLAARLLNRTGLGLDGTQTENPAGDPATLRISTYDAEHGFGWDEHRITSATEQYYGIDMSRCYYHPGEDGLVGTDDDLGYQVMIMVSGGALSLTNLKLSGYTLQNVGNVWGDPEHFLAYSGGVSSEILPDLEPDAEKADAIKRRVQTAMTGIRAAMDIETPEQPVNDLTISGASLTLRSDISMNFYVREETLNGWENAYMRFAKARYDADGNITGYDEELVKDYTVKNGCRVYSFNGINASEMSSKVTATLFATQNGKEASSKTVNYSVVTYVKNTLKSSTNAKLNTLLVDMLNYGTEAQRYWSYHLTEPANACLTAEQQAMATSTEPTLVNDKTIVAKEGASVHFKGVALTFREKVAMNVYLNVAGTSENLEAVISYQDRSGTLRSVTVDGSRFVDKRGGVYAVSFDGLDPTQMRTVCSIQVFDRSTGACVSDTLQYSVVSYAKNKQNDAKLGALVMAMIRYGDSAARFFQN